MTSTDQDMKIKLSCFLDDELEGGEIKNLYDKAIKDADVKAALANYATIKHAMRTGIGAPLGSDLWIRVREELKDEATIVIPNAKAKAYSKVGVHQIVGYALAASLLVIALGIGKSFIDNTDKVFHQQIAQSKTPDVNRIATTAESRFEDYLLIHNESAQFAGTGSIFPYARLVGSKSSER